MPDDASRPGDAEPPADGGSAGVLDPIDDPTDARAFAELIAGTIREGILVLDAELRVAAANAAFYETVGTRPSEAVGRRVDALGGGPWDGPAVRRLFEGTADWVEAELVTTGGERRALVLAARRHGPWTLLTVDDVTARVRAAEALRASEERFDLFAENAREYAVVGLDADGRITTWSPSAERMLGWTEAEAVGQSGALFFTDEDRATGAVEAELATARADGSALDERWHVRKDGSRFWGSGLMVALRDGRLRGFAKVFRDNTRQRETEAARDRERALLEAVLEAIPVGVILTDADGRIVRTNAVTHELWGVPPETTSWEGYADWVGWWPETGERIRAEEWAMSRALATGAVTRGELVRNQPFGTDERRYYLNNVAPVRDADGAIVGGVAAMLDVTEQREAEEKVHRLNRTLEARVRARTRQVRELAAALTLAEQEERRRIAHVLHDDLQQTLSGAQIHATLGAVDRVETLLSEAVATVRRLAHELSPPRLRGGTLRDLLEGLVARKRELYGLDVALDVRGGVDVPGEDLRILLYQVLREVLFNVVKHAQTGAARLLAEPFDGGVRVVVEDEGAGFDPSATDADSGLGLPSVRERIEIVGGRLAVEAAPGRGTRVTIELPAGTD